MKRLIPLSMLAAFCLFGAGEHARAGQGAFQNTGLPIPRFVSLKSDEAYLRSGPGQRYPIEWVYQKKRLPVEIIQEFEHWRKIRDPEGGEGWMHSPLLSGRRTGLIRAESPVIFRDKPDASARIVARAEPGVIVDLSRCEGAWCRVGAGGYSGWLQRNFIWGIYEDEILN